MSLVFYAWGEPVYVLLMLFSTVVDYAHGRLVEHFMQEEKEKAAKYTVLSSMIINLGLLGIFKYTDFFIGSINSLFHLQIPLLKLSLPIGISFYTFQTMSYTIDIYRGQAKAQKNIIDFGTYVALFPQLIAGPIVQYKTIAEQLRERRETSELFSQGAYRFVMGLGKKVLIANNVGLLWDTIVAMTISEISVLGAWIGAVAFAFQIYFDFSGYSDMAIGLGKMFGFEFCENFNYPYESKSITEFWRRWHISLGSWFKEYVYIPLGGNRKNHIRNIIVVWLFTGLWHGASWNFILWGAYFAILLLIEKLWIGKILVKTPAWIQHVYAVFFILLGWVIFAFDDMSKGLVYLKVMFGFSGADVVNQPTMYQITSFGVLLIIAVISCTSMPKHLYRRVCEKIHENRILVNGFYFLQNVYLVVIFLAAIAFLVEDSYNPFLYFRF